MSGLTARKIEAKLKEAWFLKNGEKMDGNCVFCDRSQFEERLIGETENSWIIATLGQISDGGYTLLVPKKHVECTGAMQVREISGDFQNIVAALMVEYQKTPIIFEHGIVGQTIRHAHIHFVPDSCDMTTRISRDFPGHNSQHINFWSDLINVYKTTPRPYLLWIDSSMDLRVCWDPPAPLQYLRIVVADALGRPERANWRNMDPELDKRLWSETVKRLAPYFKKAK